MSDIRIMIIASVGLAIANPDLRTTISHLNKDDRFRSSPQETAPAVDVRRRCRIAQTRGGPLGVIAALLEICVGSDRNLPSFGRQGISERNGMSSPHIPGLLPNKHWPSTIDRLLAGTEAERTAARETLWIEVQRYVAHYARLPIGPLADDPDVRLNIAVDVIRRLEQDDFRHLRTWRERGLRAQDGAPWWRLIWTITRRLSIDCARASHQNLAPRGERFRWARIVSLDPAVFDAAQRDTLGRSLDFLEQASEEDLRGYLSALQAMLDGGAEDEADRGGEPRRPEMSVTAVKRDPNGGSGAPR
jgi:hypothetical protein